MDTDSEGKHFVSKRIDFVRANSSPESLHVRILAGLIRVHQRPSVVPTELFGLTRGGGWGRRSAMRRIVRYIVVVVTILVVAVFVFVPRLAEQKINRVLQRPPYSVSAAARALHSKLFVADMHADPLMWNRDLVQESSYGHVDVPRLIKGGVGLQIFDAVTKVPTTLGYDNNDDHTSDVITLVAVLQRWPLRTWSSLKERALFEARKLHEFAARSNGKLTIITSRPELAAYLARRQGDSALTAGLLGIEGLHALEGDLRNLDVFRAAGFRIMGLEHFFDNQLGGSAHGISKAGLNDFGRQVVRRMEELKIIVDLAHSSPRMIDDVLAMATRPVVVSHTGVKGTCEHIRNLSDDHVRGVAATGGVIGIGYWDAAACDVSVAGIVRAIQYAVQVGGIDHVGLGSDFDGATETPFDSSGLPLLTEALLNAGFSEEEVGKIMGGNVLRVLQATLPPD